MIGIIPIVGVYISIYIYTSNGISKHDPTIGKNWAKEPIGRRAKRDAQAACEVNGVGRFCIFSGNLQQIANG